MKKHYAILRTQRVEEELETTRQEEHVNTVCEFMGSLGIPTSHTIEDVLGAAAELPQPGPPPQ